MFCIYGFVNKFWTGRIFERLRKVCGGSNLCTVLALWGIYIKKCISPVRIRLRVKKPRNASTKFRKTSESKKREKSLEISRFLVFPRSDLNWLVIMCLQVNSDADFVLANLDAARWHTSPLVKQGLASDRDLPGCNAMLVNELMILRSNPSFLAFILPFHKNKPNARLSSVWLCRLFS